MAKSFTTLLEVKIYELTGDEIGAIKKEEEEANHFRFTKTLPEYCLRDDNGKKGYTEDYLQFVESGDEKYLLFNASTLDEILSEEISGCGLDTILENVDLRPYFKELEIQTKDNITHRKLVSGQYLIIEVNYVECGSWEFTEWEAQYSVKGVLTNNLKVIELVEQ